MDLVIVESPSKARTIEKYLGQDFVVRASVGHIRDLPKSNKNAIDIEAGFVPNYEIDAGKEKVLREIAKLAKESGKIFLATDPDREGEAIAWHIKEVLENKYKIKKEVSRIAFNEITQNAVVEAMENSREIDQSLRAAQEARRVLDRLVGYDLSGIVWKKVRYGLSAGRVQSPALRILMEREREIRVFQSEKYWIIIGHFLAGGAESILTCEEEPRDQNRVKEILSAGESGIWKIQSYTEREEERSPRAPFTTSTLQQSASNQLGMSPSNTMRVAQKLYEAGHITYMRTDSTNLSAQFLVMAEKYIKKEYGSDFHKKNIFKTKSKGAQEAHEAIRPTKLTRPRLAGEGEKLYNLIFTRAVASQMASAKIMRSKLSAAVDVADFPKFSANGSRILWPGWLACDTGARGEETEIPKLSEGEKIDLQKLGKTEKETQPPNRYTEASLIKELEKRGIGRPSTYASIMKTLADRGYVERQGRTLFPTDTGDVVSTFLENNFKEYISDDFTAAMENKLDAIATGEAKYAETMSEMYHPFHKNILEREKSVEKQTDMGMVDGGHKCPKCGAEMIWKLARAGKFMSCSKFPECDGARNADGDELAGPREIGKDCPKCKDGKLVEREGRYGLFVSCNNYPKCKYIEESAEESARKKTGVACPACKGGEMVERRGRFGLFYSCSNYPECKNAIKARPTGEKCKMCGALMMSGTKTIPDRCSDKKCPNHRPDKLAA